jgi:hypothetical protein
MYQTFIRDAPAGAHHALRGRNNVHRENCRSMIWSPGNFVNMYSLITSRRFCLLDFFILVGLVSF